MSLQSWKLGEWWVVDLRYRCGEFLDGPLTLEKWGGNPFFHSEENYEDTRTA